MYRKVDAYRFIAPSVLLFALVGIIPIGVVFYNAFFTIEPAGSSRFVGLENFRSLFGDEVFWRVLKNTGVWTVSMVIVTTLVSLAAATLLNRDFKGRTLARVLTMLPWTIPPAIYAIVWKYIYNGSFGSLNLLLKSLHAIRGNVYWLSVPGVALGAVIWVGVLNSVPFTTLVLLGGLQAIPRCLYEAAEIDGATSWGKFRYITLPSLRYVLMVVTLFNTIFIFRNFPIVWVLTQGGPVNYTEIMATYIYKTAFKALNWGLASALAVLGFGILMVFVLGYTFAVGRQDGSL